MKIEANYPPESVQHCLNQSKSSNYSKGLQWNNRMLCLLTRNLNRAGIIFWGCEKNQGCVSHGYWSTVNDVSGGKNKKNFLGLVVVKSKEWITKLLTQQSIGGEYDWELYWVTNIVEYQMISIEKRKEDDQINFSSSIDGSEVRAVAAYVSLKLCRVNNFRLYNSLTNDRVFHIVFGMWEPFKPQS